MHTEFLPYASQSIDQSDVLEVSKALQSKIITRGPYVEAFEALVASYCGAKYAVAFSSGSAALVGAYHAAGVNASDRLLTTTNSFIATAGAGVHYKATPVFIDIDRETGNLNLDLLESNLNQPSSRGRTVVVPVHFSGIAVDMPLLDNMIRNTETIVIEDAAHALGSTYRDGQKVGCCAWSQMTMFSFHPAKTITTGEGGMITTNDEDLYRRLLLFRNNGLERNPSRMQGEANPWSYEVVEITNNYNFTEMQAALGISQMKRLDAFIEKRRKLVAQYRERLKGLEHIRLFKDEWDSSTAFHIFVVQIDFKALKKTRAQIMNALKEKGIGTQVHYIPLYKHPVFAKSAGDLSDYFPQTEGYYSEALTLPLYYDLTLENVDYIVSSLNELLKS